MQLELLIRELQHPGVLRGRWVVVQEPAAHEAGGIDGEAYTGWWLEGKGHIRDAEIPTRVWEGESREESDAIDGRLDGTEARPDGERYLDDQLRVLDLQCDVYTRQRDAANRETDRQRGVEARTSSHGEPGRVGPGEPQIEVRRQSARWQHATHEPIAVAA